MVFLVAPAVALAMPCQAGHSLVVVLRFPKATMEEIVMSPYIGEPVAVVARAQQARMAHILPLVLVVLACQVRLLDQRSLAAAAVVAAVQVLVVLVVLAEVE